MGNAPSPTRAAGAAKTLILPAARRPREISGRYPNLEVVALCPVRANKLGEAAGLNRQDAKPERSRPGDVPALASNP